MDSLDATNGLIPTFASLGYERRANVEIKKTTSNLMNLVDFSSLMFETRSILDGYQTSNSIH
ncbi:hypothetical protein Brsp06_03836 [Brucella sp. NBRC 13694]|jgi:hypothetical protein|nr:hypothetical protein [Brucella anthropi]NIH73979.1 hypothetical protein [Ochrobactrum sp. P20RRXII]